MADINISNQLISDLLSAGTPEQPYEWTLTASNVSIDPNEPNIIKFNFPEGLFWKVAEPPNSLPYDSVFMNTTYTERLLTKVVSGEYIIWSDDQFMAAYTDSGYWAYGATNVGSPGVILTGAGSAENTPCEIEWTEIAIGDHETPPPAPFPSESILNYYGYDFVSCVPNEILSNYKVINDNTIEIGPPDIDRPFAGTGRLFVAFESVY